MQNVHRTDSPSMPRADKPVDTAATSTLKLFIKKIGGLLQPHVDVPVIFHENANKGGRQCLFHNQTYFGE